MNKKFSVPRIGMVYKKETRKLYFFRKTSIEVLKAWPELRAWKKDCWNPDWRNIRSKIILPSRDIEEWINKIEKTLEDIEPIIKAFDCFSAEINEKKNKLALLQWVSCIPKPVRDIVRLFPDRHWHLLSFMNSCGEKADNLAISNPPLAYMLASNWIFHKPAVKKPLRSARSLLKKKQRDILPWLGFPGTNEIRNILMKIPHQSINVKSLLLLRDIINNPGSTKHLKIMSHLTNINTGVIHVLSDKRISEMLTSGSLKEISFNRNEDIVPFSYLMISETLYYLDILRTLDHQFNLNFKFTNLKTRKFQEKIKTIFTKKAENINPDFHSPPLQGTENIIPITNPRDLKKEGLDLEHCIFNFLTEIMIDKNLYAYKVFGEKRCTLVIVRYEQDWQFYELRSTKNSEPGEKTKKMVDKWLTQNGLCSMPPSFKRRGFHDYQLLPFDDGAPF